MRATIDFMLGQWLDLQRLIERPRFREHTVQTCGAVLDTCERMATEVFSPINRQVDVHEPSVTNGRVTLPQVTHDALAAYVASGMLSATQDECAGGMQLPCVVDMAANAFFYKASLPVVSYALLTAANANLLMTHGTSQQRKVFAARELSGQWFGTMCLSEPQAGSSLSDIATRAVPDGDGSDADPLGPRYRLVGNKMWISAGEHEITENIVHLVLAKIPGPDGRLVPGTRGISLFIVPKMHVDEEGNLTGERNDVQLAGLNHKLGFRGTTNCLLNFGERGGAIGYRVGAPGEGLRCMFHMMNEARIKVGLGAAMLGFAGYEASVQYASTRTQGRPGGPGGPGGKNVSSPPVAIIDHADVRRMLLAQKAYVEGALALELYCARLVDEFATGQTPDREQSRLLLEVLTPIAKSWPSEWCLEANSLAIQVHGGYGYTRDFPVEQYWRDNRLNMIHEGTHGIQAADLLGRKVLMEDGAALGTLMGRVQATVDCARRLPGLADSAEELQEWTDRLQVTTREARVAGMPLGVLANATAYLQAFGHLVIAWLWLDMATALQDRDDTLALGKRHAMKFFFAHELPKLGPWLRVVSLRETTSLEMPAEAF
jgi:alkylation response protein AidB-like acyl-CoA dehydrogenase